ncbi:MAG TPA: sugar ABC transporter permease [Roseiflexaceae bacterium]|nr:sugar ABC transporter permease [Roseiflexaceae bacterium]
MALIKTGPRAARPRVSRLALIEGVQGYLFAAPFIIGFLVFTAYPMLYSVYLVFQHWDLIGPPRPAGLDNLARLLEDPNARLALGNTLFYTALAVPGQIVIAFVLALALTQRLRFRALYRAGFYLPIIVPMVASAIVWQRVFHPEQGILNIGLGAVGLPQPAWLQDPLLARLAFVLMSFWMIGRQMVVFIAGLAAIPRPLLEAASIDGAGPLQRLWSVVVPLMTPLILYNTVIAVVNSFQIFIPALIMTQGGPENATLFSVLYIYRQGFEFFNMGYAAALAWELFALVIGFTLVQFYLSRRWVYYGDEP